MFKDELAIVPNKPGSYQMYNEFGLIIYVGKAKDLKKRLSSYFRGAHDAKTTKMVSEIAYFKYLVTTNELEAFLLELNLIKEHNPKYNILLKDDKSYPYIEYTKRPYPKLSVVRYLKVKKSPDKLLFGPYVNGYAARRIVQLINRLYPLKKCNHKPKDVCLYYHIHECLGYCNKEYLDNDVKKMESEVIQFLKGNETIIKDQLTKRIEYYSNEMNYEVALELKRELDYMEILLEKQRIELITKEDIDAINYYFDNGFMAIEILFIRSGKLIGSHDSIEAVTDDYLSELESYVALFYNNKEMPKQIIIPQELNAKALEVAINTKVINVIKGRKKQILDMAYLNAKINHQNNFKRHERTLSRTTGANDELSSLLGINIKRIDIFDNSNLFGSHSVSGMVVFIDGLPAKKKYRKYKLLNEKNDDYNAMKEVIYRRYQRALVESDGLPELILVDGGINQIRAAKETLSKLNLSIKVCGLVKNDKHQTNELLDGDSLEILKIDKTTNLFHYITRIQEEVHRYTINYHKQIRSKGSISSALDNIPGIGNKRKKELIKVFGSLKKIKEATFEELQTVLPQEIAQKLAKYLSEKT